MLIVDIKSIKINDKNSRKVLLENIFFKVKAGEFISILGKNGTGKTTLLNSLFSNKFSKQVEVDGKVFYDEINLYDDTKAALELKQKIKIVFQDSINSFNPQHNIKQIIENDKTDPKIFEDLIQYFDLPEMNVLSKKFIWELSSGMAQRFAIASAISSLPNILLLDEPTSALDLYSSNLLKNILLQYKEKESLSTITVTQNDSFAKSISDSIYVIDEKKLKPL